MTRWKWRDYFHFCKNLELAVIVFKTSVVKSLGNFSLLVETCIIFKYVKGRGREMLAEQEGERPR